MLDVREFLFAIASFGNQSEVFTWLSLSTLCSFSALFLSTLILYHTPIPLSTLFLKFFQFFFCARRGRFPREECSS